MFDSLADKLQATLADVRGRGTLTEDDINAAMREIRLALLEADVNFKVVKSFTGAVKERALGADVIGQLNPGQQVVKIVSDELTTLMGGESEELQFASRPPTVIVMAGLQGSGKTTATGKLARFLHEQHGSSVAVAACDVYRPAAVEQLVKVGAQAGAAVYEQGTDRDPVRIAAWARDRAISEGKDVLIVDTSGRLHVDTELMKELAEIKKAVRPNAVLLVVDAMTGQDAVQVAEQFGAVVDFDGVIMTKLDGDARGGAALSVKGVVGKPIAFASTGERLADFDLFHPDRMADRILGMGDVLSLIEQADRTMDQDVVAKGAARLMSGQFTLEDFLTQLRQVKKMGSMGGLMKLMPGMSKEMRQAAGEIDDGEVAKVEAIVSSMTPGERDDVAVLDGSRRSRVARGSGTSIQDVNQLIKQFKEMQKMMKGMASGNMPNIPGMPSMGGMGGRAGRKLAAQAAGAGGPDLDMLSQLMGDDADPGALAGFPGLPAPGPAKAVVSTNKGTKKKKKGGRVTPPKGR
jgi:signal recognition particle subunit SRP54